MTRPLPSLIISATPETAALWLAKSLNCLSLPWPVSPMVFVFGNQEEQERGLSAIREALTKGE